MTQPEPTLWVMKRAMELHYQAFQHLKSIERPESRDLQAALELLSIVWIRLENRLGVAEISGEEFDADYLADLETAVSRITQKSS